MAGNRQHGAENALIRYAAALDLLAHHADAVPDLLVAGFLSPDGAGEQRREDGEAETPTPGGPGRPHEMERTVGARREPA